MNSILTTVGCVLMLAGSDISVQEKDHVAPFWEEIQAALVKNAGNDEKAVGLLREQIAKVVEKHACKLRPGEHTKKYVSADKTLVLVIAANGADGAKGADAEAADDKAKVVVAVAGNGGAGGAGQSGGAGGSATARAPNGVAIAVAGRGGNGVSGGAGGSSRANGRVRSIGVAGAGGAADQPQPDRCGR